MEVLHWRPFIFAFCSDVRMIKIVRLLFLGFPHPSQPSHTVAPGEQFSLSCTLLPGVSRPVQREGRWSSVTAQVPAGVEFLPEGLPPCRLQLSAPQWWLKLTQTQPLSLHSMGASSFWMFLSVPCCPPPFSPVWYALLFPLTCVKSNPLVT